MKKLLFVTGCISLLFVMTSTVYGHDAHQSHITETSSFEADIDVLDTAADELEGIREKIEKENDPAKQKVLKKEYKEKMKSCMHNMEHLDEKIAKKNSMKGGDKKKKMKKTVEMNDERIIVLEKKVELLQEMLAGLLLQ